MSYQPSEEVLEKYAKILINFGLNNGKGIKEGEVIYLSSPLSALPFYRALKKVIFDSGGLAISNLEDDMGGFEKYYYQHATHKQLTAFPDMYLKGLVDQIDHRVAVIANYDPHELDKVDPKKMVIKQKSAEPLIRWVDKKEDEGRLTWTLALYGTPAMAKEAGLSLKEYWQQIIKACYLDYTNPIAKWRKVSKEIERVAKKLTKLKINDLHFEGKDVDLHIKVGQNRQWLSGRGNNIPSFEVFTSPDWRGTEGWISFNQPVSKYGLKVEGIKLHFKNGRVVKASATRGEKFLKEHILTDKGASQVGEISLTDKRLSRINKIMATDLFDENIGGPFGNMHLALGKSFKDTHFKKDIGKLSESFFDDNGFNNSIIHTDMISTTDRTVTATLAGGKQKIIYQKGQFTI